MLLLYGLTRITVYSPPPFPHGTLIAPGCYGVDRAGRPVYVQQPGNIDLEQLFKFTTEERCVRYHVQV